MFVRALFVAALIPVLGGGCVAPTPAGSTGGSDTTAPGDSTGSASSASSSGSADTTAAPGSSRGGGSSGAADCGGAPTFAVERGPGSFTMQIDVFGVPVYATAETDPTKVAHAAHVLAQYLDNDEDCVVDDPAVLAAMLAGDAAMIMAPSEDELPFEIEGQPLFGDETFPPGTGGGQFDATLEEVLHLVTSLGYAEAYPEQFGEQAGSRLADAMDIARGGHFESIPDEYPKDAWYHYDDFTCDYGCMASEYIYWALTSRLGAQQDEERCEEISDEWELCTPRAVETRDTAVTELLTDPRFSVPTVLPDGSYR